MLQYSLSPSENVSTFDVRVPVDLDLHVLVRPQVLGIAGTGIVLDLLAYFLHFPSPDYVDPMNAYVENCHTCTGIYIYMCVCVCVCVC